MPTIRRLPEEVASGIAAGEVVERPASLLKELLENALDAGASRISVEAAGAGKKALRVVDDGCGMDRADAELCLERHATSKIASLDDLQRLRSFGFRGEALYAIAAVSRLELSTCQHGAGSGWRIAAEGGSVRSSAPAPAVPGTRVCVEDLFFNTPARLKFLKSDAFEKSRLASVIEEVALAHPELRLSYKSESRRLLDFAPQEESRRLAAVLGAELAGRLVPVSVDRPGLRARLYVSPAEGLVATREFQRWFVNRRPVEARILQQALYKAYEELRHGGRHPVCVGFLELSPNSFDVNVHPGKREIRFHADRDVFGVISGVLASTLAKAKAPAPIERVPVYSTTPSRVGEVPAHYLGGRALLPEDPIFSLHARPAQALARPDGFPRWFTPPYRYLGQIEKSYLLFEAAGGLFVLDQHAAAERILFETLLAQVESGNVEVQRLMLPLSVELPASAAARVLSRRARLSRLGFELEPFGKTGLNVLAVPSLFHDAADLKEMLHRLIERIEDAPGAAGGAAQDLLATVACKASVKAHDALGEREALWLLEELAACKDGSCCPHGRRAMLALSRDELARRFQRPGAPPL